MACRRLQVMAWVLRALPELGVSGSRPNQKVGKAKNYKVYVPYGVGVPVSGSSQYCATLLRIVSRGLRYCRVKVGAALHHQHLHLALPLFPMSSSPPHLQPAPASRITQAQVNTNPHYQNFSSWSFTCVGSAFAPWHRICILQLALAIGTEVALALTNIALAAE
ncbi:uncharacterized protein BDZ83DRAFT_647830 [Colletotrichum acutatum]|uniref:Uncharacterized protein n=1 Tax=Glomerella acutata TaxID=27357 RepID=A0AAD8XLJ8_GLOAC|nr:uncharacterized protein BDZ83DRAFT_647830 [Colletotrichum acutatum]KAK1729543.1 hypothetical protein BDZ83DRAFT_647830 [Colletotrichum acutatum]